MQPETKIETAQKDSLPTNDAVTLDELWFDAPPVSGVRRTTTAPPPSVEKVGEFLGDPDVDAWLR